MVKNELNNTGFSLVELIIVIAIMAILSAALAPQLMKYIEKSRISTDAQTCQSIKTCVNTSLTNDAVWIDVAHNWLSGKDLYFYVKRDEASGDIFFKGIATNGNFRRELKPMLSNLQNPKQVGMNSYKVHIKLATDTKLDEAGNDLGTTYTVKEITVTTSSYDFSDDTQHIFSTEP